jgi:hypothetical protein
MTLKSVKARRCMLLSCAMRLLLIAASLIACAGCGVGYRDYVSREGGLYDGRGNVLSFQHAFSEAAVDKVHRQAERHCAETKLTAVRTRRTCTMTECSTDYQCMTSEEAARVAAPEVKK